MIFNTTQIPSTKTIISVAASAAGTFMLVRSFARQYLPHEVQSYFVMKLKKFIASLSNELTFVIEEYDVDGDGLNQNQLFKAAALYLKPRIPPYVKRIKINLPNKGTEISLFAERHEEIVDIFDGVHLKWKFVSQSVSGIKPNKSVSDARSNVGFFELNFHKRHKDLVLGSYLPHMLEKSEESNRKKKSLKLFSLRYDGYEVRAWKSVNLDHPATFDTLAMDSDMKKMIKDDLERFLKRKEFYRRVGKAWKRGYLLFGPPGTGKSSLIAAIANYLKFDVYDLDLTTIKGNMDLKRVLISTGNRSILVVEDIDCSIELQDRHIAQRCAANPMISNWLGAGFNPEAKLQMTLSGLLNVADGLWSSIGDERIIIFTTNHKDRLDPALLRPGRMDVHINMSYCTPSGFKMLAANYLGITEHRLFSKIEDLMEKAMVTPADVAEQLMRNEEPGIALRGLIEFLEIKMENDESRAKEEEEKKAAEAERDKKLEGKINETQGVQKIQ